MKNRTNVKAGLTPVLIRPTPRPIATDGGGIFSTDGGGIFSTDGGGALASGR